MRNLRRLKHYTELTARFGKTAILVLFLFHSMLVLFVLKSRTTYNWNLTRFVPVPYRPLPPQNNVVYIKTHKCASETLSAIFRRYGYERNLSFVLPVDGRNNLGWPEPLDPGMYRPSKRGTYNILCEHTILTLPHMADIMPNDTMFITGIREPFEHLKSAFNYFNIKTLGAVDGSNPLSEYLRHLDKYDARYKAVSNTRRNAYCVPAHLSMTQNSMAFDLGFPTGFAKGTTDHTRNYTAVQEWLDMLDKRMDFVVIVEYFDLSLVMLRRTLRWNTKDILYIRRNTQSYKVAQKIDEQLLRNYKVWSHVDYLLYDHFNKTLWQKVAQQSNDLWNEYRDFDSVLNKTRTFCNAAKHRRNEILQFPDQPWSDSFNVTARDCAVIKSRLMPELRRQYDQIKVPVKYRRRSGQPC